MFHLTILYYNTVFVTQHYDVAQSGKLGNYLFVLS